MTDHEIAALGLGVSTCALLLAAWGVHHARQATIHAKDAQRRQDLAERPELHARAQLWRGGPWYWRLNFSEIRAAPPPQWQLASLEVLDPKEWGLFFLDPAEPMPDQPKAAWKVNYGLDTELDVITAPRKQAMLWRRKESGENPACKIAVGLHRLNGQSARIVLDVRF